LVTVTSYIEPHVSTVRSFEDVAVKSERNGVIIGTRLPGFRYSISATTTAAAATLSAAERGRTVAPSGLPKMFSIVRHGIGKTELEREEHAAAKGARRMARKTVAPTPQVCPVASTSLQHT
jgi:hypothetical protein